MNPSSNSPNISRNLVLFSPPARSSILGVIFFLLIALSTNIILPSVTEKTLGIIVTLSVLAFMTILVLILFLL
ncbi:MAG: hypothetical protein GX958_05100 [Desulfitobacterium sp.]|nr:hypothetical protein [Desulfitobacterium sp.]